MLPRMRLSTLCRLAWRPAVRRAARKSGGARALLSPGKGCPAFLPHREICSTWRCPAKQQVAQGSGRLQGSLAREVIENSKKALSFLQTEHPTFKPTLSIVQVGDDDLGQEVRNFADEIGLNIVCSCLPHDYTESEVADEIIKLNEDHNIQGLVLHQFNKSYTSKILNTVKLEKDVNGVTDANLGRLVHGDMNECVIPPIASAVIQLLEKLANTSLDGKKVLLLGVEGPLEVSLQCLLRRKGVMTMSCPWKMKQLQATVNAVPN
ncbi:UNVERIFIED_CONTAM: hypothetical protein K2H54_062784 [Gekko kuhli]